MHTALFNEDDTVFNLGYRVRQFEAVERMSIEELSNSFVLICLDRLLCTVHPETATVSLQKICLNLLQALRI
jgi:hypothetical protein